MEKEIFNQLIERCEQSPLHYFRYKTGGEEIEFKKSPDQSLTTKAETQMAVPLSPTPTVPGLETLCSEESSVLTECYTVKSLGVGLVSNITVAVGNKIEKEAVICTLEAMKLYNDVVSPVAGIVTELLIEEGQSVEYHQAICRIKVSADEI